MTTVGSIRRPQDREAAIRRLLTAADEAFVPPLSAAARSEVSRYDGGDGLTSIDAYVEACLDRPLLAAVDDGQLVGFASLDAVTESEPLADYTPTTHVTVLVVDEAYRGRGIATRLYEHLLDSPPAGLPGSAVSTKTWHTNRAHISILDSLGFACVERVPDDRKPGVDTVYYAREI
ncbi:MAG: N-acetyltransferase family protein [Halohasta sp.]